MRAFWSDLMYGWRMLRKDAGFTAVAVLTLALGIGASTTVFSWVDDLLLHPIPGVTNPSEVVAFETLAPNGQALTTSYPDYRDYRDHLKLISGLALSRPNAFTLGSDVAPKRKWGELVSGNYFAVLGVKPYLGRLFQPSEYGDAQGAYPVAVISYRLWRAEFGSSPDMVGKILRINRHDLTVVGVAEPNFRGSSAGLAFDVWVPAVMQSQLTGVEDWMLRDRQTRQFMVIARLKPGVPLEQARAEVAALARRMAEADADTNAGIGATLLPMWKAHFSASELMRTPLEILLAVCAILVLIVCANVANLLLARCTARQREFSVRLALGAGRARLVRQVLTESLLLASAGAFGGVSLARWLGGSLQHLLPPVDTPVVTDFRLSSDALVFAVVLGILTALAASLVPAWNSAGANLNDTLKEGGRGSADGTQSHKTRSLLVISEVSLALVALVSAGLFARSFQAARTISPGFNSDHVLLTRFYLASNGYTLDDRKTFSRQLRERLEAQPGVTSVAYSDAVPLGFEPSWWEDLRIQGYSPATGENMKIFRNVAAPGYFRLMDIPILEGRDFTEQDNLKSQPVMIVNQTFVQKFIPGGDAIGRRVHGWGEWFTIVGVAKDSKYNHLTEPAMPYFYVPFQQVYRADMFLAFFVRTAGSLGDAASTMRREVRSLDPNVTPLDVVPLGDYMTASLFPEKTGAIMLAALGILALVLSAVGLYSVMAYSVSRKAHDIGIRVALGARQSQVLRLVLREGTKLALTGLAVGIAVTLALTRLVSSYLYGVTSADPWTYGAVAILLTMVALLACYIPARRAARLDPIKALRLD